MTATWYLIFALLGIGAVAGLCWLLWKATETGMRR